MTESAQRIRARHVRFALPAPLVAAVVLLTGCVTPPVLAPTPTPVPSNVLQARIDGCGPFAQEQRLGPPWPAEIAVVASEGRRVTLSVETAEQGSHGVHELGFTEVQLVSDGEVRGIAVADTWASLNRLEGQMVVEIGACPVGDEPPTAAVPDGTYELHATGTVHPVDHAHAVGEWWLAPPLQVRVVQGVIAP